MMMKFVYAHFIPLRSNDLKMQIYGILKKRGLFLVHLTVNLRAKSEND